MPVASAMPDDALITAFDNAVKIYHHHHRQPQPAPSSDDAPTSPPGHLLDGVPGWEAALLHQGQAASEPEAAPPQDDGPLPHAGAPSRRTGRQQASSAARTAGQPTTSAPAAAGLSGTDTWGQHQPYQPYQHGGWYSHNAPYPPPYPHHGPPPNPYGPPPMPPPPPPFHPPPHGPSGGLCPWHAAHATSNHHHGQQQQQQHHHYHYYYPTEAGSCDAAAAGSAQTAAAGATSAPQQEAALKLPPDLDSLVKVAAAGVPSGQHPAAVEAACEAALERARQVGGGGQLAGLLMVWFYAGLESARLAAAG